jgi:pimeloyl-ACP methyl ester carboxylesterase
MPFVQVDGAKLHYEETGSGHPILFVHEFAGDSRSWEPQMRHFGRLYRCIAYNARGYPPSEVPTEVSQYDQAIAASDIAAVIRGLNLGRAHVVGLSMGGFATLHFGLRTPELATALVVAGCGYGASKPEREKFQAESRALADQFEREGMSPVAARYAQGPFRVQFQNKDPRGWAEFARSFAEHAVLGAINTLRGVQARRPSLYDLRPELERLQVPTLIVTGDEDEPCLEPNLFLKRTIPASGLWIAPKTGHTINLEEPDAFNAELHRFFNAVDKGRWPRRDPRSISGSIMLAGDRKV